MLRPFLVPCVGWNDVMAMGRESCGSWVTKDDPFPSLYLTLSVDVASPVLLRTSQSRRCQSRPFSWSSGVLSGSSQRLASQTWQTETILAEDIGGRSTSSQFRPGDSKAARFGQHAGYSWRQLRLLDMLLKERERERESLQCLVSNLCEMSDDGIDRKQGQ